MPTFGRFAGVVLVAAVLAAASTAGDGAPLRVTQAPSTLRTQRLARQTRQRVNFGPSRRQLLSVRLRGAEETTLRILAIRIDFPSPRPEHGCSISGDGAFDFSGEDTADRYPGAPPHNKRYFEGLLDALGRYYAVQSHGALRVEYHVIPDGENEAFRMPRQTAYYSYYQDPSDLLEREDRLALLAKDALAAADTLSTVNMSEFDTYIIFHAGGDWQHDFAGDSPCDLITAYIPALSTFLGGPVMVDDSTHAVDDVIVMPEAINQDLDPAYEIAGLHSELAHEFGHQLGLLDLYDYSYFSNVVGYWALMDNGDGMAFQDQTGRILTGVLPPSLCVFSKEMLGWVAPQELMHAGDYSVTASTVAPSAYRLTLSDTECFLLENRQVDTDGDATVYLKTSHGVILGPTTAAGDTTTSEYDAGLPGSGLLIWHVDTAQGLWEQGLPNYLEYDAEADTLIRHRGLALEEADGIENLGLQYFESAGSPGETDSVDPAGMPGDPFRAGHNDHFGDDTRPASWDNAARRTHIEVRNISPAGVTMTFSFARTWEQEGWPVVVALGPLTPPSVVRTSAGEPVILVGARGKAFAVGADRVPVQLWESSQQVSNPPAAFPVADEREFLVAMGAQGGRVALFPLRGPGIGAPLPGWPVSPTGRALSTPVLADVDGDGDPEVALGSADGSACLLTIAGAMAPGWPVRRGDTPVGTPAVADLDRDGAKDLVVCGSGVTALRLDGTALSGWPVLEGETSLRDPLVADLEGDGALEVIVGSASRVWVLSAVGQPLSGWPVTPASDLASQFVILDIDGDGVLDVVAADRRGGIWAWSSAGVPVADCNGSVRGIGSAALSLLGLDADDDGTPEFLHISGREADLRESTGHSLAGWPLAVPALTGGTLVDLDGDGDIEAVLADSTGSLHAWDLPYLEGPGWFLPRGDAAMTGWAGAGASPSSSVTLVDAGDFYVWPSPVRGSGHVSFRARPGALIALTILDGGGRRRGEWTGTASGQRQDWPFDTWLPVGVYFCRLEARADGSIASLLHRFAVIGEE